MKTKYLLFYTLYFIAINPINAQDLVRSDKELFLMGSNFKISALADTEENAKLAVDKAIREVERIEELISSWKETSQTTYINKNAGIKPISVSPELFKLIRRSIRISDMTDGAFDISFASTKNIWTFDKGEHKLPDSSTVKNASAFINYRDIFLDEIKSSVYIQEGMSIGFGAIGKGYAADMAKQVMVKSPGCKGGVINAGGDLIAWGTGKAEDGFSIQISDPKNPTRPLAWLQVDDLAVVTSGNYEKYFTCSGKRYAHIINPKTGWPCTGIKSVSVVSKSTELADALATSIFVLGVSSSLDLINGLDGVECLIVDDQDQLHRSQNLELNYY